MHNFNTRLQVEYLVPFHTSPGLLYAFYRNADQGRRKRYPPPQVLSQASEKQMTLNFRSDHSFRTKVAVVNNIVPLQPKVLFF